MSNGLLTVRVKVHRLDGTSQEGEGLYMPLADRVAFERRFGKSILGSMDDLREEEAAFFCWSLLRRTGMEPGEFEPFVDGIETLEIEQVGGEEPNPTDQAPQPGDSPG